MATCQYVASCSLDFFCHIPSSSHLVVSFLYIEVLEGYISLFLVCIHRWPRCVFHLRNGFHKCFHHVNHGRCGSWILFSCSVFDFYFSFIFIVIIYHWVDSFPKWSKLDARKEFPFLKCRLLMSIMSDTTLSLFFQVISKASGSFVALLILISLVWCMPFTWIICLNKIGKEFTICSILSGFFVSTLLPPPLCCH